MKATTQDLADKNVQAFLKTIRYAEGTLGANGYNIMFTGKTFSSFTDHPRQLNCAMSNGKQLCSTAAGAYQFLSKTWDALKKKLNLPDFSPQSQDLAAVQLIIDKGALGDVKAGRFEIAVNKVSKIWASLPGAGYGQPEKKLATLLNTYKQQGGTTA